jgi:nitroimidazol reductase NimA-like FMN-containing flavoprotein (pyridoxamine 5'-phosphate oxidase superfamily)
MQPPSGRATVKRNARRAEYDPSVIRAILDEQQICHVAYVEDGEPRMISTLCMCDGDYLYLHGNRQSALLRHMAAGGEVCISVMAVDGVVVARSGFHCSMNYRSAMVFGRGEGVTGDLHREALDRFVDVLIPGHGDHVRPPTREELAATAVVRVKLDEMSAKIRTGDPIDAEGDDALDVWAGQIPVEQVARMPVPSGDLRKDIGLPAYLAEYVAARA